jgi:hypothetical protein
VVDSPQSNAVTFPRLAVVAHMTAAESSDYVIPVEPMRFSVE